jgi:ribonucleoside-triphosphate reductase (thioredoxin)
MVDLNKQLKFRLNAEFVASYKDKTPPFGFNGLGELACMRTYSRIKEDGTNEAWVDTVQRVVEGTYSMQRRWIHANGLYWNHRKAQASAQEMFDRMFYMKFLPPGRGLWAMGSALTEERDLWAALNNCAYVSTENIVSDLEEPFTFLMDASMLGIGVGFDTKGRDKVLIHEPLPAEGVTVIEDTREGWVTSVGQLLLSYMEPNNPSVEFDYSQIRGYGEPIKGFGGVASGPAPLKELHERIRKQFTGRAGELITSRDIVDVMNYIGACVVAGNVRRTAEIAFGTPDDRDYLDLKNYEVNPERAAYGWTSNNSILADLGMDYTEAAQRIVDNGEPGFAWLANMQAYSRMGSPADHKDYRVRGGNPCLEQSLESYELCCLVETFPARHDSLEDYQRTLKFAYLYAKTVTLGRTPWTRTNEVLLRNRRIGLSQSGIVQALAKLGIQEYKRWCEEGYQTIQTYDRLYSDWLKIPRSIKTTSIKPSGTVSLLAGATPGMHFPEARMYIRRMRLGRYSDLVAPLRAAGYSVDPAEESPEDTVVVSVPVKIEEDIRTASEVSMWEQLQLAAFLQAYWADNQVSCTITFDPETEGPQIAHALEYFQYHLKGVSFLPRHKGTTAYAQMPYEAITEEVYEQMTAQLKPLRLVGIHDEQADIEKFCSNDTCTL